MARLGDKGGNNRGQKKGERYDTESLRNQIVIFANGKMNCS